MTLPVTGSIVHDLAGIVTNIQAFTGILEASPDHPSRADFLAVVAREARGSVQAVKDLQLVNEIESDRFPRQVAEISLREVLADVIRTTERSDVILPDGDKVVKVGRDVLVTLLVRSLQIIEGPGEGATSPLTYATVEGQTELTLDLARTTYDGEVSRDLTSGRKDLRPLALLCSAAERWGVPSELREDRWLVFSFS